MLTANPLVREVDEKAPRVGLESPLQIVEETPVFKNSSAKSGALSPTDPDLQRLLDAWPTLPDAMRAGILAMIAAASKK